MSPDKEDKELAAIQKVIGALEPLEPEARERVIQYVFQRLKIQPDRASPPVVHPTPAHEASVVTGPIPDEHGQLKRQPDIRSFAEEKSPRSANEMAAVIAYYLSELAPPGDRKSEISTADIEKYFKQAGFPLPAVPRVTLANAKAAGYFDSGVKRGRYRLNPVGHNLVAHGLPTCEGAAGTTSRKRSRSKKKGVRKKKASQAKGVSRKKVGRKKSGPRR